MCDVKQGVQVIEAFRFWGLTIDNRVLMCFTNRTVQTAAKQRPTVSMTTDVMHALKASIRIIIV